MSFTPNAQNTPNIYYRTHISTNGRLNIPAQLRKKANLKDGDEVLLTLKDNTIQVQSLEIVIKEAQTIVAEYFDGDNLMDELKAMRTADVMREKQKLSPKE